MESIEAATLELAKCSGLPVPEFEIRNLGKRKVLLVKRFDISEQGGRYHMISMQTLLQAQGYYFLGYQNMFDAVKAHSCQSSFMSFLRVMLQKNELLTASPGNPAADDPGSGLQRGWHLFKYPVISALDKDNGCVEKIIGRGQGCSFFGIRGRFLSSCRKHRYF